MDSSDIGSINSSADGVKLLSHTHDQFYQNILKNCYAFQINQLKPKPQAEQALGRKSPGESFGEVVVPFVIPKSS